MRYFITFWLCFLCCFGAAGQEGNTANLLSQATEALKENPNETIRITNYVLEKASEPQELLFAAYLLTCGHYIKGNYEEALEVGMKYAETTSDTNVSTHIQLHLVISIILKELQINTLAKHYSSKAILLVKESKEEASYHWVDQIISHYALQNSDEIHATSLPQQLQFLTNAEHFPIVSLININLELAQQYIASADLDASQPYFSATFKQIENKKLGSFLKAKALTSYSDYLYLKNKPEVAIDSLKTALKLAQQFNNLSQQALISEAIAKNYLALNNRTQFDIYNQQVASLNNTIGDADNDAVNKAYNLFNTIENEKLNELQASAKQVKILLIAILFVFILFLVVVKLRYNAILNQYRKFIAFLEKREKQTTLKTPAKSQTVRTPNVPKEAEELLIAKLSGFENSLDFTSKDISLSRLALQFETNTKYLSKVVNTHKKKNFNVYINELRINYIIEKLNNDPTYLQYKISYLAEASGFSSHSIFTTVFKSVTGISPTTFISILRNKQETKSA